MQNWTNEMWMAIAITFVVGLIIGYVILGLTKGNVKKYVKLEKEFKKVKAEKEVLKTHLEAHFSESAVLLSTLAKDYKKLYTHLADSSEKLLPEAHSIELFKQLQSESNKEEVVSKKEEVIKMEKENVEVLPETENPQSEDTARTEQEQVK